MKKNSLFQFVLIPVILLQIVFFANPPTRVVQAESPEPDPLNGVWDKPLVPSGVFPIHQEWYHVPYGANPGVAGSTISDLDNDGRQEILVSDEYYGGYGWNNRWLILRAVADDQYQVDYISDRFTDRYIDSLQAADLNGDGIQEIIASAFGAQYQDRIFFYSGSDYSLLGLFRPIIEAYALEVADVNADGRAEILVSDNVGIVAYSIGDDYSPQVLWETAGYGGWDLKVANVDNDVAVEIVSSSGYVLNSATRAVEWDYSANGFGRSLGVGDTDGDGQPEIIAGRVVDTVGVFNAINHTLEWEIMNNYEINALTVADINGDGRPEILFGGDWRKLFAYDGQSHQELWRIVDNTSSISGIAVGDPDFDGEIEMIWGEKDYNRRLTITNLEDRSIEWQPVLYGGYYPVTTVGDLEGDGHKEIVRMVGSNVCVFNADTHGLTAQMAVDMTVNSIRLGDVDQDGQVEIVLAGYKNYSGFLQIHDGVSLALEKTTYVFNSAKFTALELGDVDSDGQMEFVGGVSSSGGTGTSTMIVVFDGASGHVEWQSYRLSANNSAFSDLHLADADGNGHVEIFASIKGGDTFVFDGSDHTLRAQIPNADYALTTADLDGDGKPSLLISKNSGVYESYNASSFVRESTYLHDGGNGATALQVVDFDEDGSLEWLAAEGGYLRIYSNDTGALLWQSQGLDLRYPNDLGIYGQMFVGQMDADARPEILIGSEEGLYQFEGPDLNPLLGSRMQVSQLRAQPGDPLVYTMTMQNRGGATYADARIDNPLPAEIAYIPDSLWASSGNAVIENNTVTWNGTLGGFQTVTLTYEVLIDPAVDRSGQILNSADLSAGGAVQTASAATALGDQLSFLPAIQKGIAVNHCIDYIDDFSDPTSGWPVFEDENVLFNYLNGRYFIQANNTNYIYMVAAPTCRRENYTVEANFAWYFDHGDSYGLVFGVTDDFSQYYLFAFNDADRGSFAIFYHDVNGFDPIVNWTPTNYKPSEIYLRVTREGGRISPAVNDLELGDFYDYRIIGLTRAGVFMNPYTVYTGLYPRLVVDYFKMRLIRNGVGANPADPISESNPVSPQMSPWQLEAVGTSLMQ